VAHIVGTNGNDSLVGTNAQDTLEGLGGNDTLIGNDASDVLIGGAGADSMNGGLGGDYYIVGSGDLLSDPGGFDSVESNVSWTLGAGFEVLHLVGTATTSGSGNELDNWMTGSEGNNWMRGLQGNDSILAGGGNDTINMSNGSGASYGNDFIDGGDGIDTLDYGAAARTAVLVDLQAGTASGGGTGGVGSAQVQFVENVNGSGFDDVISGNSAANFLYGFNGNDILDGREGNDRLEGAAGSDRYTFTVTPGTANADTIIGFASGADKVVLDASAHAGLGSGNFAAGDARFTSGAGRNTAQDSSDRVIYNTTTGQLWYDSDGTGAAPVQLIATLQGAPSLVATDIAAQGSSAGGGTFNGTAGNDTLIGGPGNDTLNGFGGHDYIEGREGADSMVGGDGNDTLEGGTGADVGLAEETTLADTLNGGLGDDHFYVRDNDIIVDSGGEDTVHTDAWTYTLGAGFENLAYTTFQFSDGEGVFLQFTGNGLNNVIDAEGPWHSGGSTLDGAGGNDTLTGSGQVTFRFSGDYGNDHVIGNNISDTLDFSAAQGPVFINLAAGTASGGGPGGSGTVSMEGNVGNAVGGSFNDHIIGNPGGSAYFDYPRLSGGGGDDTLEGAATGTPYYLFGEDGNDRLVSHLGDDFMLHGGAGLDSFVLAYASGESWLGDFTSGSDTIVLDAFFMPEVGPNGDFSAGDERFHAAAGATGGQEADDRVIYNTTTGEIFYDADGSGSGAARQIAAVAPETVLVASDFAVENGTDAGQVINGTAGNDSLAGGSGNDTINGFGGHDTIDGSEGADSISGGDGNDVMRGGMNSSTGDGWADTFVGGLGNDEYHVEGGMDVILADAGGIDTVYAMGDWTLAGGFENLHADDFIGTAWTFTGNELDNIMSSASEGGTLFGMGGNDQLFLANVQNFSDAHGGDGNDTLSAGRSSELFGDAGNDVLIADNIGTDMTGGVGSDSFLFTESGLSAAIHDFASGVDKIRLDGGGSMSALGPSGNFAAGDARFHTGAAAHDADDRVIYNAATGELWYDGDGNGGGAAELIANLQAGASVVVTDIAVDNGSAPGGQTINGTANNDTLVGGAGNDTINGNAGADLIQGMGGNDSLLGSTGWDTLQGGDGNDWLHADGWSDTMTGGAGNDSFVWNDSGNNTRDTVTDFVSGTDELLFDNATMTALGANGSWAAGDGRFWAAAGATAGHDADDRLVYNTSNGNLYYDADGSGAGAAQVVATFQGGVSISASDITVI
jgi:Ca2+-binding RTX toxin-like protein